MLTNAQGDESLDPEDGDDRMPSANGKTALLGIASAVLFGVGLLFSEAVGEVALDIDLKPFFVPYLLIAIWRYGLTTLSVAVGAGFAEGFMDVFEGYELDDPIGFLGYVIGFTAFGWYLDRVANNPESSRSLVIGAILGAFIQALFEGFAFFLFESSSGLYEAVLSVLGNTVTHGFVLGAIPLVIIYPWLNHRIRAG